MSHNSATQKDFTAFISYSHDDEAFAIRLQNYLESYRLPQALRRACPDVPPTMRPVARDVETTSSGELHTELAKVIARSRQLIVICSSSSSQPNREGKRYVDWEVDCFQKEDAMGVSGHIIPVVMRNPCTESVDDCLPPCVKNAKYPIIDVAEVGEERAFNAVVARLAGVHADALWAYHNRSKRIRRRIVALLLLVLFAAFFGMYESQFFTNDEYYAAIGWKGGDGLSALMPVGVESTKLTKRDSKNRACYFLFRYKGNQLVSMSHMQGEDYTDGDIHHGCFLPAVMIFGYDGDRLSKITYMTQTNREMLSVTASGGKNLIRVSKTDTQGKEQSVSASSLGNMLIGGLGAMAPEANNGGLLYPYAKIDWDAGQNTLYLYYICTDGKEISAEKRGCVSGVCLRLNPVTHLIDEGRWMGRPLCYRGVTNTRGRAEDGYPLMERRFELSGECENKQGDAHLGSILYEWGANGCCTRRVELDADGHMILNRQFGYHDSSFISEIQESDGWGNCDGTVLLERSSGGVIWRLRDLNGNRIPFPGGMVRTRCSYLPDKGMEVYYFETEDGDPMHPEGEPFNCIYLKKNELNLPEELYYYHTSFSLKTYSSELIAVNNSSGYWKIKWLYDGNGQVISHQCYDTEENIVNGAAGSEPFGATAFPMIFSYNAQQGAGPH